MARLESFRANSSRYAVLIDPTTQVTHLADTDVIDLTECLDYSRLSTTPRRQSQGGAERSLVSNLPSPLFDDFLSLLPLGNSRPDSAAMPHPSAFSMSPMPDFSNLMAASPDVNNRPGSSRNQVGGGTNATAPGDAESLSQASNPSTTSSRHHQLSVHTGLTSVNPDHHIPRERSIPGSVEVALPPVEAPSYRRQSFSSVGRRPWYERDNRTSPEDVNGLEMDGMMAIGPMIH